MENSIKEIIREYKSRILLDDINSLKVTEDSKQINIINSSNPILSIMNKVEKKCIERYQPTISDLKLYSVDTKPVHSAVGRGYVKNIQIKNDLIKIRSAHTYCGGESYSIVKVPLSYFDMSEEEIKKTHMKWCNDNFLTQIRRSKINLKNQKLREIKKLQEEIKELSK